MYNNGKRNSSLERTAPINGNENLLLSSVKKSEYDVDES